MSRSRSSTRRPGVGVLSRPGPPAPSPQLARLIADAQRLRDGGQLDEALALYERASALAPTNAQARAAAGLLHYAAGRAREAIPHLEAAVRVVPTAAELLVPLACAHADAGDRTIAREALQVVLHRDPRHHDALVAMALLACDESGPSAAIEYASRALTVKDSASAWSMMGHALVAAHDFPLALEAFRNALEREPDHLLSGRHTAFLQLLLGDYTNGWASYAVRHRVPGNRVSPRTIDSPRWQGECVTGKHMLVTVEEGLGDQMMFARLTQELRARGARVTLECDTELVRLFSTLDGPEAVIALGAPLPPHDYHVPLLDLLRWLPVTAARIPSSPAYLAPPGEPSPELVAALQCARERAGSRRLIGVVWSGNPRHGNDRNRSMGIAGIAMLLDVSGVSIVSLQKGHGAKQLAALERMRPGAVLDVGAVCTDFADTAHAVAALDLVITVDTSVAHLAGALGTPVWVLVPRIPDWRWQLDREDTPWYPSMRLFRQPNAGNWSAVIERIRVALAG